MHTQPPTMGLDWSHMAKGSPQKGSACPLSLGTVTGLGHHSLHKTSVLSHGGHILDMVFGSELVVFLIKPKSKYPVSPALEAESKPWRRHVPRQQKQNISANQSLDEGPVTCNPRFV